MRPTERRRLAPYLILALIAYGVFIAADDLTVVSTMLPQMIVDLEIPIPSGLDQAAWIVNAYLIAYVVTMPFMGRVSDLYGRRFVFVVSLLLFAAGSLWVPLAPNLTWLIVGRAITALGGGAMVPVAMAIIGDVFPPRQRAFAMGLLGAVDTAGWIWGPLYGALLVRYLNWRWQFYINIPASLVGAALAYYALAGLQPHERDRRLDWVGVVLLTAGLVALNVALIRSGGGANAPTSFEALVTQRRDSPSVLPLYGGAALAFGLFAWVERRVGRPLVDLALLRLRNFNLAGLVNLTAGFVLIIAMVDVPLFINVILAEDVRSAAVASGRVLSALTLSMALASILGGWLCQRWGYRLPTLLGLIGTLGGFLLMGRSWDLGVGYGTMAAQLALVGFGFGLVISPVATAVVDSVWTEQRGVASALVILLRLMGMTVGLSALTAWGLHRFGVITRSLPPIPLADTAAQVQRAMEVTARIIRELFLISALVTAVALVPAVLLRDRVRSPRPTVHEEGSGRRET
ncbi:MAG: MFS transporter [Chloroflexi bacterium]|nr:MAG: MFS transporter [Chloroflexota bacterium]